jgi:hypothetical protein
LLAHLFHPELVAWSGPDDAFERMEFLPVASHT